MKAGGVIAAGLVVEALVADVFLIRARRDPISTVVRGSLAGRTITLLLAAHLVRSWRFDPLSAAGRWLTERFRQRRARTWA